MPQFNETSRPMIEITISRTALRRYLVVVPLSLLLLLGVIGAAVSPLVNGHPVILTRERLALKHYLEEAQGWIQRLDELIVRLDTLSPPSIAVTTEVLTSTSTLSATLIPTGSLPVKVTLPSQAPLSAFTTPASQPTNLFDRAHAAEQVIQDLQADRVVSGRRRSIEWSNVERLSAQRQRRSGYLLSRPAGTGGSDGCPR